MALLALWNPNIQFLKTDGTINAGGKLVVTDHNDAESVPANYSDADGTTLNTSPIILDALGRATCYIDDRSTYDLYVKDADGATLWTVPEMTPGAETIVVRAGFSVSSNDSSVAVVISVDPNGVTNYDLSIQDEIEDVRVNGASVVTDKVANIDVPVAGTASPLMDGTASAGASGKYAREDHVHPSDTSREAVANKTTVVLGTSDSKYPTDKAVADFVNSSVAGKKDKQTAVTFTGSTLKTLTSMTQDANGELAVTFSDIQSASTSQKGVVQLSDSTASASSETAATSAAVKQAYDLAASKQEAITWMTDAEALQLWTDAWDAAT